MIIDDLAKGASKAVKNISKVSNASADEIGDVGNALLKALDGQADDGARFVDNIPKGKKTPAPVKETRAQAKARKAADRASRDAMHSEGGVADLRELESEIKYHNTYDMDANGQISFLDEGMGYDPKLDSNRPVTEQEVYKEAVANSKPKYHEGADGQMGMFRDNPDMVSGEQTSMFDPPPAAAAPSGGGIDDVLEGQVAMPDHIMEPKSGLDAVKENLNPNSAKNKWKRQWRKDHAGARRATAQREAASRSAQNEAERAAKKGGLGFVGTAAVAGVVGFGAGAGGYIAMDSGMETQQAPPPNYHGGY